MLKLFSVESQKKWLFMCLFPTSKKSLKEKSFKIIKVLNFQVTPFKAVDIGVGFMIGLGALIIIVISLISLLCGKK